jgi:predicted ATP-dependent serine protease
VPSSLNAETYARTVRECATRRGLIAAANQIATLAFDSTRDISDVMAGSLEALQSQAAGTERARFILRDAAFALEPQPPIDYIVDGLITAGSVNVFYGEAGSKKTYTALSLAVSVASGGKWLDFDTRQCPVLIVDEESGEHRFSRRLNAAIRGALCQDEELPLHFVSLAGFKLDEDADPALLHNLVKSTGAKLVIIDALADVMSGDENDKVDVQPAFNALRKISESTEAAILLIHHAGKAEGYRGSSAIKGAVDLMVQVQSENGSNFVNFKSEKNRDGGQSSWAAEAVWTTDQFYLQTSEQTLGEKPNRSEAYVLGYLAKNGPALLDEIKDAADTCSAEAARKAVYRLAEAGKIIRTNPGEKGSKARYGIS